MTIEMTIREKYDAADQELRAAEHRLQELREEENQIASQLEELRTKRAQAVRQGNHAAIDSFDAEILRAGRQAERARILSAETAASVEDLCKKLAPIAEELRREALATREAELEERARAIAAAFNEEIWCRGHRMLAEFLATLEERRALSGNTATVQSIEDSLIPMGDSLENRGWRVTHRRSARFTMHAALPQGESVPASQPTAQPSQSEPSAQLISHPRPPIAAFSGPRT